MNFDINKMSKEEIIEHQNRVIKSKVSSMLEKYHMLTAIIAAGSLEELAEKTRLASEKLREVRKDCRIEERKLIYLKDEIAEHEKLKGLGKISEDLVHNLSEIKNLLVNTGMYDEYDPYDDGY